MAVVLQAFHHLLRVGLRQPVRPMVLLAAMSLPGLSGCANWLGSPHKAETAVVERDPSPAPSFRDESSDGQATGLSSEARDIERRLGYK
jgi:hypothetical protein